MVTIIYGNKGSGKTKKIIDSANTCYEKAKGNVVYITDTKEHSLEIKHVIRYINTQDYWINSIDRLIGLLGGLVAGNSDIEYIFIDGAARMSKAELSKMTDFYAFLGKLSDEYGLNFTLTVSAERDNLPEFIRKYID